MASNEDQLERIGQQIEGIIIAFLSLSWFFIGLRVWTRTYVRYNFGWDDLTMIFAGMTYTVYCSCLLYINSRGGGTHVTSIAQLDNLTKWVIIGEATYVVTIFVIKYSLAIFFMRIVVERWHKSLIYANVAISGISSTGSFFFVIFRCGPDVGHTATLQVLDKCAGKTWNLFFAYQQSVIAFITDCVFVVLPTIFLWNSNMERRSKIIVCFILSLATVGCICSAIRFQFLDGLADVHDFFWGSTNIAMWSTIELGTGIIAGCMATLRPLLKKVFNTARSIRSNISSQLQKSTSTNSTLRQQRHTSTELYSMDWPRMPQETDVEHVGAKANKQQHGGNEFIMVRPNPRGQGESTECIIKA